MLRRALILGWLLYGALGPALSGIAADSGQVRKEPAPGGTASSPASGRRSALAGVAALEKPVSYAEAKIPLGELVEKVTADTGVTLTAHKEVADEPGTVYVKDLSARELLEQRADLLDYRWSRRVAASGGAGERASGGDGETAAQPPGTSAPTLNAQRPTPTFEIWQDLASKQREEALRGGI